MAKKSSGKVRVDFSKVEDRKSTRVPEGDYPVKITKVKHTESEKGNPMLVFSFEITEGKYAGETLIDRCVLTEKALFRLRNLLQAAGKKVPKKAVNLDVKGLKGLELGITTVDDEYEGRISSKVGDYLSIDVLKGQDVGDDDEDEEDEDEDEDEDDDDEEEEDLEEVDLDDM